MKPDKRALCARPPSLGRAIPCEPQGVKHASFCPKHLVFIMCFAFVLSISGFVYGQPLEDPFLVSSQKVAGNSEGAQRPTAGDEPCGFTPRGEGGRVPPFIEKIPFLFELAPETLLSQGKGQATITLKIPDGYFVYQKSINITASGVAVSVRLPESHEKEDPFEGTKVKVFDAGNHPILLLVENPNPSQVFQFSINYQGCSSQTCFMPSTKEFEIHFKNSPTSSVEVLSEIASTENSLQASTLSTALSFSDVPPEISENQKDGSDSFDFAQTINKFGMFWALLTAFLGGLLVSFTPCVYPMIPITISIIGGKGASQSIRKGFLLSLIYVLGLSCAYALLGVLVALFGSQVRGIIQGAFFQLFMAGFFMILALSMFDVFLIQIPSALQQRIMGFTKKSGFLNIFFLGAISGLVASPCVAAPLAGILAFIAATGSMLYGFLMLFSFAWGMSALLLLVGTFSGALGALPKAGEWMNKVKEFFGFILLGMALFFAYPIFGPKLGSLCLVLLLAAFAGFLGLFSPKQSEDNLGNRILKCWGVIVLFIALLLASNAAINWGIISLPQLAQSEVKKSELMWHSTLEAGIIEAKRTHRPIFVDFRADWCSICLELERDVFPDSRVSQLLSQMTLVRIDATKNDEPIVQLMKNFKVLGLPTLVFLDSGGIERKNLRLIGKTEVPKLAENLFKALQK